MRCVIFSILTTTVFVVILNQIFKNGRKEVKLLTEYLFKAKIYQLIDKGSAKIIALWTICNVLAQFVKQGDFRTKEAIFEIGGKNKTGKQISNATLPSFLVKDDVLVASKKTIPLMYFGFLY